ncbi:acyl-CoA dehydrogenase family protein [Glycomyces paridis]|uniref:Acyl-CoA dehydrogenase n=1 Tax=Glycomyces paridis TaxID=2126555 RepID=A0A4V4HPJ7_9ACTN|nr:acyl-CoA dehydrogenase family protein [Glycomyces paridis]THV30226.1 acyl-CoA dehydrogenase [Glycomyces paridis]
MPDDDLKALRGIGRELAEGLRTHSLDVHEGREAAEDVVAALPAEYWCLGLRPDRNPKPLREGGRTLPVRSCREFTALMEELCRGDAGLALAMPFSSMSAMLMEQMLDASQLDAHYARMSERPTWTFFALTEPERGSDAGAITTTLEPGEDGAVLNGVKRYIGNGARAYCGLVFARNTAASGMFAVQPVLVPSDAPGFTAELLDTMGLKGAGLSEIRLEGVRVPVADGARTAPTGLRGAMQTFDTFRPCVGAMALGAGTAVYEYVDRELRAGAQRNWRDRFVHRIEATRGLIATAAAALDAGRGDGSVSSAAKLSAVRLADALAAAAVDVLGPAARLDHPLIDKWDGDIRGIEFMEGTSDIQRQTIAQGWIAGRLPLVGARPGEGR